MRLLQTIVSRTGFRDPATNARRTELFRDLFGVGRNQRADVVLLPGGYWTVSNEAGVEPLVAEVADLAGAAGVVVAAGVDVQSSRGEVSAGKKGPAAGEFPYFG